MAKNNNLTDFLTDVANAIREKKGTTAKINPQDFSREIASITTGGGGGGGGGGSTSSTVSKSDVNFYDYDGKLLHSYTASAFLALSALPDPPTREGLTCQGWNHDITKAKEYVSSYGVLDIGATYITDDDKTRLYIKIAALGKMNVPLYFNQSVANGVTIDWGDGSSAQTLSGTGNVNTIHTYTEIGDYCISLTVNSGTLGLGHNSSSYCIMGPTVDTSKVYCNMLNKIEIGKSVTSIRGYAFYNCYSLSLVTIPLSVKVIDNYAFSDCYSLSYIVIPNGTTTINNRAFYNCYSLSSIAITESVTGIYSYAFYNCYSLSYIVIPEKVKTVGNYAFNNCHSLSYVIISDSVTSIGNNTFNNCKSLSSVIIPDSVTNIGTGAFNYCYGIAFYDFRSAKSVPTLGSYAFTSISSDCKIVVPDSLYDSWIAATNWSTYASNIIKTSDYEAL